MRQKIRKFSKVFSVFIVLIMSFIAYGDLTISSQFIVPENTALELGYFYKTSKPIKTHDIKDEKPQSVEALSKNDDELSSKINIRLLGVFPIKTSTIKQSQRKYLIPGGQAFGLRIYSDGLLVVSVGRVETPEGKISPGELAGIRSGDIIKSVNGKDIKKIDEFTKLVEKSNGKKLDIGLVRNSKDLNLKLRPVKADYDGKYKAGLWLRDSSAGIGTMTFYQASDGLFAGLGHAVSDTDTGKIIPLYSGEALTAKINGAYKGSNGRAGELLGVFGDENIGHLDLNTKTGVYGFLESYNKNAIPLPVAMKQEIKPGSAQIISTVNEDGPKMYDIEILKINAGTDSNERNMTIEVVDEDLISITGGIVQGMSGSPIIQNGHLVGAVTHVFLNNSLQGYGIFIENMIKTAESLADNIGMDKVA